MMSVSTSEIAQSVKAHVPMMRSAASGSPFPMSIETRGAPPALTSAANADMIMIAGSVTPTPVSAAAPMRGRWPM